MKRLPEPWLILFNRFDGLFKPLDVLECCDSFCRVRKTRISFEKESLIAYNLSKIH